MNAEPGFVRPSVGRIPRHDLYMGNADKFVTFETPDGGRFGQQVGVIACGGGPLFHRNSPVRRRVALRDQLLILRIKACGDHGGPQPFRR